jgi:hypothetical protein
VLAEPLEAQIHHDRDFIQSAEVAVGFYREALFKTRGSVRRRWRSAAFGQKQGPLARSAAH